MFADPVSYSLKSVAVNCNPFGSNVCDPLWKQLVIFGYASVRFGPHEMRKTKLSGGLIEGCEGCEGTFSLALAFSLGLALWAPALRAEGGIGWHKDPRASSLRTTYQEHGSKKIMENESICNETFNGASEVILYASALDTFGAQVHLCRTSIWTRR